MDAASVLAGDDEVLARVGPGRDPVSSWDVQFAARQALGPRGSISLDRATREQVLQSVILSRSMAQLSAGEMSDLERARLGKKVAAYRERLLVEAYLERHAKPRPPTEDDLRAYYERHPDTFGPQPERSFELAYIDLGDDLTVRGALMRELGKLEHADDWRSAIAEGQARGLPLGYRQGDVELANLPSKLRAAAKKLSPSEATHIIPLGSRAYLLRLTSVGDRPGKTFEDVRERIADILAPVATREAVDAVREQVSAQVTVERSGA